MRSLPHYQKKGKSELQLGTKYWSNIAQDPTKPQRGLGAEFKWYSTYLASTDLSSIPSNKRNKTKP
jgi:hypothetical protein